MCAENTSSNNKYSIKMITDINAFKELSAVWNDLASRQGHDTPFLSHEWFMLWMDHFLNDNKLLILLLCKEDIVLTIAPFLVTEETFCSIKIRKLQLIGNAYSPVRNFIFRNHDKISKKIYLSHIISYLLTNFRTWDLIDLSPIASDDETFFILQNLIRACRRKYIDQVDLANWYVDKIDYSGDEYLNRRSKKIRSELRRRRTRLEALGDLEFRIIKNGNEIDKYMDYYYEVYARSWKGKEKIGPTFHRALAKLAAEQGWLRLAFLFLNGVPIASQFRIVFNDACFFLKTAYDCQYRKYGPGIIMLADMIKYVIDVDHVREIDFGPGDEPYKRSWASQKRKMRKIIIFNNTLKGRFLALLKLKVSPFFQRHERLREIKKRISWDFMKFRL